MRVIPGSFSILSFILLLTTALSMMDVSGSKERDDIPLFGRMTASDTVRTGQFSYFTENIGQWDPSVRFVGRTSFGFVYLLTEGVCYEISGDDPGFVTRIQFEGSEYTLPYGKGDAGFPTNFFIGNDPSKWVTGARSYREVVYENIWPNIDIKYYFIDAVFKYDIDLGAFSDPNDIRFCVGGSDLVRIRDDSIELSKGDSFSLFDSQLVAYGTDGISVPVSFRKVDEDTYGFDVKKDPGESVTIDPVIYSTVLRGLASDTYCDFRVDRWNNTVIYGLLMNPVFPVTPGTYNTTPRATDTFVIKLNGNGTNIIFATIIGGWHGDIPKGMDIDQNGDIYLTGQTYSNDYPTTPGAYQDTFFRDSDIFISKLNCTGSHLEWSTFVGGDHHDEGEVIKVYKDRIYLGGHTLSHFFPVPGGTLGGVHGCAILIIMDINGTTITDTAQWDGYYGEHVVDITVNSDGDVVLCGWTASTDFPTTPHSVQRYTGGLICSAFVIKYDIGNASTVFSSRFGGDGVTYAYEVEVDGNDDIYFTGLTCKFGLTDYPTTPGVVDDIHGGVQEGYLTKISSDGTKLLYSTLLGGSDNDTATSIELDRAGNVYVTGKTMSADFPVSPGCHDHTLNGIWDGWIMKVNHNATAILNSTYIGMNGDELIGSGTLDRDGHIRFLGETTSSDFPVTSGAYTFGNQSYGGIFLTIISIESVPSLVINLSAVEGDACIHLDWEPPIDSGASDILGYAVYRGRSNRTMTLFETLGPETNYTDHELTVGIEMFYAVSSINRIGEGPLSGPVSNISSSLASPPSNLMARPLKAEVLVTFEPPKNTGGVPITGYSLFRNGTILKNITNGDLVFRDFQVGKGIYHTYTATTWNRNGESRMSDPVTVRSLMEPSAPRNFSGRSGIGFVELRWNPPYDNGGRDIERYVISKGLSMSGMSPIEYIPYDHVCLRDQNVIDGEIYYYSITAENEIGPSPSSNIVKITPRSVPNPPEDVTIVQGRGQITINWSMPHFDGGSPVLEYMVYHHGPYEEPKLLISIDAKVMNITHDGLLPGEIHYYYVTAINSVGESASSDIVHGFAYGPPSPPRNVQAIRGRGSIELKWDPPSSNGFSPITSYNLYRRIHDSGIENIGTVQESANRYLDKDLSSGIPYQYSISAVNIYGESSLSDEISAKTLSKPDSPRNIEAVPHSGYIELSWDPPLDTGGNSISAYQVFRIDPGDLLVRLSALDGNCTTFRDFDILLGEEYAYYIVSINDIGPSLPSSIVRAMMIGKPSPPIGINVEYIGDRVLLSWDQPQSDGGTPIIGYNVYRSNGSRSEVLIRTVSPYVLRFVDLEALPGHIYRYSVTAVNSVGESDSSYRVTVEIPEKEDEEREKRSDYTLPLSLVLALQILIILTVVAIRSLSRRRKGNFVQPDLVMEWGDE